MKDEPKMWELYFDGSKCIHGAGTGIVLVSPTNDVIPMTYKIGFNCTNNMEKYEVFILGLRAAALLNIRELNIYGDSKLVVNQVEYILYYTRRELHKLV